MERLIVDMDEVMADPMGAMIEWYTDTYNLPVDYSKMIGSSWIHGFAPEHQAECRQRLFAPGFFRHLPVMENCREVLQEINKKYELFIVSAAVEFPNSLKDKIDWLQDHFPFISWKQITLCGDKRLVHGDHIIDDHERNLVHFPGKKYLFTAAHNLNLTDYHRINNWKEAAVIFLK